MKKKFLYILSTGLVAFGLGSCDKNTEVIDKDVTPPPYAKFNTMAAADTIRTYYVTNGGPAYKIPVGITNVSGAARTVQFTYTSRAAVAGTQYNAPASMSFPAGKVLDSLSVQGLFSGYGSASRVDTLKIAINGSGDVKANAYKNNFYLIMRKYCDVLLANLGGSYTRTFENGTYGPYTSTVTGVTSTGATSATATLNNIYDSGISGTITFNWADPAAFSVTIPAGQNTGFTSGGLPLLLRGTPGKTSTFSSCDNTLTLYLDLYTTAGLYDTWTMTMAR